MKVTAITQQKHHTERYSVFVDGNFAFGLIMQDILYFKLKEGSEVSEETYDFILENLVYIKAQDKALHYLGYKMRTRWEVVKKLEEQEYSEEVVERVLAFLEKYSYLDDLAYCKSHIRERERLNPRGKFALKMELRQKGVSNKLIEQALEESEVDELTGAIRLIHKKVRNLEDLDEKEKKRVVGFLQRRGYSCDIIKEALQEAKNQ